MSGLMPTGKVYMLDEDDSAAVNGDMRIVRPPDHHFNDMPKENTRYAYLLAQVRFAGVWVRYGGDHGKALRLWCEDGVSCFTQMRMGLYRAVLATIREPFRLGGDYLYAPVDDGVYNDLDALAGMLLYKDVVVRERKPEPETEKPKPADKKKPARARRKIVYGDQGNF